MKPSLYSAEFWEGFLSGMVPFDTVMEARMLSVLAFRSGVPVEQVKEQMQFYLRTKVSGEIHEGSETLH